HAAAVREDVRNQEDPSLVEEVVRVRRGRSVRALRDDLRFHAGRVLRRQDTLEGARREDRHVEFEKRLVRDFLRARETDDAPGPFLEREDLLRVERLVAVDAAFRIGYSDNPRTLLVVHEPRIMVADVPEPLI